MKNQEIVEKNIKNIIASLGGLMILGLIMILLVTGDFNTPFSKLDAFESTTIKISFLVLLLQTFDNNVARFFAKILKRISESKIQTPHRNKLLKLSGFIFSPITHKEIFEPIIADWQEEYFEALFKKEIWKARWINVRYTYAFLAAMWQKSPIGDLIEFVVKIAKQ